MPMTFEFVFNDIPPHEPPLQASSSPIPRIPIWPITSIFTERKYINPKGMGGGGMDLPI